MLTWLPLTAWLLLGQHRLREQWVGAAGFAISMLVLLFIGRTFNNYYLRVADHRRGGGGARLAGRWPLALRAARASLAPLLAAVPRPRACRRACRLQPVEERCAP